MIWGPTIRIVQDRLYGAGYKLAKLCFHAGKGFCFTAFVVHDFEPVFDEFSRILILGTIPSPKSRESGFYYGHPQNRFWPLLADLLHDDLPITNHQKKGLLLRHHIALWDVLKSCGITGADDASITSPVPNDIEGLLSKTKVSKIYTNGKKATELYRRFCHEGIKLSGIYLPSTSPANRGRYPMERLKTEWSVLLSDLSEES